MEGSSYEKGKYFEEKNCKVNERLSKNSFHLMKNEFNLEEDQKND